MEDLNSFISLLNNYKETDDQINDGLIHLFTKAWNIKYIMLFFEEEIDLGPIVPKSIKNNRTFVVFCSNDNRSISLYNDNGVINIFNPSGMKNLDLTARIDKELINKFENYEAYTLKHIKREIPIKTVDEWTLHLFYCKLRTLGLTDLDAYKFIKKNKKLVFKFNNYFNTYIPDVKTLKELEDILENLEPDNSCITPDHLYQQKFLTDKTGYYVSPMELRYNNNYKEITQYPVLYNSNISVIPVIRYYIDCDYSHANIIFIKDDIAEIFEPQIITINMKIMDVQLKEYFDDHGIKYKRYNKQLLPQTLYENRKNNTIKLKKCKEGEYGLCLLFCLFYIHLRYFNLTHIQAVNYLNSNPEKIRKYLRYYTNSVALYK